MIRPICREDASKSLFRQDDESPVYRSREYDKGRKVSSGARHVQDCIVATRLFEASRLVEVIVIDTIANTTSAVAAP